MDKLERLRAHAHERIEEITAELADDDADKSMPPVQRGSRETELQTWRVALRLIDEDGANYFDSVTPKGYDL